MTNEELELIQRALWAGIDDQSLWFYHQYLMSSFDTNYAAASIAPDLTTEDKLKYLDREIAEIREMLECAEDCKWIYQSLIDLNIMCKDLAGKWSCDVREVRAWVDKLADLDPLRAGRWRDLRASL